MKRRIPSNDRERSMERLKSELDRFIEGAAKSSDAKVDSFSSKHSTRTVLSLGGVELIHDYFNDFRQDLIFAAGIGHKRLENTMLAYDFGTPVLSFDYTGSTLQAHMVDLVSDALQQLNDAYTAQANE